jgi:hypothetical protein
MACGMGEDGGVMKPKKPNRQWTRPALDAAWNCRVSKDQKRLALAICRDTETGQSDLGRTALAWLLDMHEAAGERLPSEMERRAILASVATICARFASAANNPPA